MHTLRHQRHNSTYVHTISEPCECANSSSRCCVVVSLDSQPKVSLHILWMIKHACLKIRYATAMSYKSKALEKCPAFLTTPKSSLALGFRERRQRIIHPLSSSCLLHDWSGEAITVLRVCYVTCLLLPSLVPSFYFKHPTAIPASLKWQPVLGWGWDHL